LIKKIIYYSLMAVSAAFILIALLFLIASIQNPARMNIAMAIGAIGAAIFYFSFSAISRLNYSSAKNLEILIVRCAKKNNGYISAEEAMRTLYVNRDEFEAAIAIMQNEGSVTSEYRDGSAYYKLRDFSPARKRRCEFCKTEYNIRDAITKCPNCGGNVVIE